MEAHVHQVRSRYKRAENEIVNLQSQNQDLQSQLNLSSSLNFDLFSRIQNLQIEVIHTFINVQESIHSGNIPRSL
ncbi:hypothetical protein HZS_5622 [Henneguya salminicola]|nr:hypothetical protein HZS_5622 [Henneguya salminicola]